MKLEDSVLIKRIIEAAIMAADKPLNLKEINELFDELESPSAELIEEALNNINDDCEKRGYELVKVASGYRFQVKQELSKWVSKLWKEKTPRYSRALLETLALIAYRQPITRGEIENIRGVAVSSQIIRTLLEREWIKGVGHRDVPGRPAIYATTKLFLDYFNLKSLDQLPPLAEVRDLKAISEDFNIELPLEMEEKVANSEDSANGDAEDKPSTNDVENHQEDSAEHQSEESSDLNESNESDRSDEPSNQLVDNSENDEQSQEESPQHGSLEIIGTEADTQIDTQTDTTVDTPSDATTEPYITEQSITEQAIPEKTTN